MPDEDLSWVERELATKSPEQLAAELVGLPYVPPAYKLMTGRELANLPPPKWLIRHVLPETGLAAIFGAPGSGKTFLALDLANAVSTGREWFGYRVKHAPVSYIALEGEGGIAKRYKAIMQRCPDECRMRFSVQPFDLVDAGQITDLADSILRADGAGGLTIIDTLNRATPGCDENSAADMGRIIAGAKLLQDLTGGLVLLVHHAGKDSMKGMRGHSSLHAALDAAIEVTRVSDAREWKVAKSKDGHDGDSHPFRLEVVEVDRDEEGEPVTSCVVIEDQAAETVKRVKLPQGDTQRIVYVAICELLKNARHFGQAGAPSQRPCIELESAILEVASKLSCRPDQRQFQARRAINAMHSKDIFKVSEGWIWLV